MNLVLSLVIFRLPPLSGIDLSPLVVWLAALLLIGVLRSFLT